MISAQTLSCLYSAPQDIVFFSNSTESIESRPIKFLFPLSLSNQDLVSSAVDVEIIDYFTLFGSIASFAFVQSGELQLTLEIEDVVNDILPLLSAGSIFSVDSDSRFLYSPQDKLLNSFLGTAKVSNLGMRSVPDSKYYFFISNSSPIRYISGHKFYKLLWKANVAIPVGFAQSFWLNSSDQRVFKKFQDSSFLIDNLIRVFIREYKYLNIITLQPDAVTRANHNHSIVDLLQVEYPIPVAQPHIPYHIDTNGFTSRYLTITVYGNEADSSIRTPPFRMKIFGDVLGKILSPASKPVEFSSVQGLFSSNLIMIAVSAGTDDYLIQDVKSIYSGSITPRVTVYDDELAKEGVDGFSQSIATFNNIKEAASLLSGEVKIVVPEVSEGSLLGATYDLVTLVIWTNNIEPSNIEGVSSGHCKFLLGVFSPDNRYGTSRFLYLDDTTNKENNQHIPWIPDNGHSVLLSDWKSNLITFIKERANIFKIVGFISYLTEINWTSVEIEDSILYFGYPEILPYLLLSEPDSDNEITLSRNTTNSKILSMRTAENKILDKSLFYNTRTSDLIEAASVLRENPSFNSGAFESMVSIITSLKYRKFAGVLAEMEDGVVHDQWMVDIVVSFFTEERQIEVLNYFTSFVCNPFPIAKILLNGDIDARNEDIFRLPSIVSSDGVSAIVEPEISYRNNIIKDVYITRTVSLKPLSIYPEYLLEASYITGTKFIRLIDACGGESKCGMVELKGLSSNHKILPLAMVNNRYCMQSTAKEIPFAISPVSFTEKAIATVTSPKLTTKIDFSAVLEYAGDSSVYSDISDFKSIQYSFVLVDEINPYLRDFTNDTIFSGGVSIGTEIDLLPFLQGESHVWITTTSIAKTLSYPGHFSLGGKSTVSMVDGDISMGVSVCQDLHSISSVFKIRVSVIVLRTAKTSSLSSPLGSISTNEQISSLFGFVEQNSIMLKTFFPTKIDKANISAKILSFEVSEEDFYKNFYVPFYYVDEVELDGISLPSKIGDGNIAEVKIKEANSGGTKEKPVASYGYICGMRSYIDYQRFDHIYVSGSPILFGNLPRSIVELLNSGYIREMQTTIFTQGKKIENADIFKRSLVDIGISMLEDTSTVIDWSMEDFKLEQSDFADSMSFEALSDLGEVVARGLQNIVESIGEDVELDEEGGAGGSLAYFPEFPSRPSSYDNALETTLEVKQFFVSTGEPDV